MSRALANRRTDILRAAARLFRHYGPAKTTISDIAREVGIAVGSVYLEFASKDAILGELSKNEHAAVLTAMRQVDEDLPFEQRFKAILAARFCAMVDVSEKGAHACELVLCQASAVTQAYQAFHSEEHELLKDLIAAAVAGQACRQLDPDITARAVQNAFYRFSPPRLFELDREEARRQVEELAELLVQGMRVRKEE